MNIKAKAISAPKDPRDPSNGVFVEGCFRDFRDFKENSDEILKNISQISRFNDLIKNNDELRHDIIEMRKNRIIEREINILERVRKLISEGKDSIAFSEFYSGFPSCLPHRSRNNFLNRNL